MLIDAIGVRASRSEIASNDVTASRWVWLTPAAPQRRYRRPFVFARSRTQSPPTECSDHVAQATSAWTAQRVRQPVSRRLLLTLSPVTLGCRIAWTRFSLLSLSLSPGMKAKQSVSFGLSLVSE